jgi:hypothetical protein
MPDEMQRPPLSRPVDDARGAAFTAAAPGASADATAGGLHRQVRLLQLEVEWLSTRSTFLRGFRSDWPASPGEWPYWIGIGVFGAVGLYCMAYLGSGYRYEWGRHALGLAVAPAVVCGLCYLLFEGRRFRRAQRKYEQRRAELLAGDSSWDTVAGPTTEASEART